jgi:hypothetical protein
MKLTMTFLKSKRRKNMRSTMAFLKSKGGEKTIYPKGYFCTYDENKIIPSYLNFILKINNIKPYKKQVKQLIKQNNGIFCETNQANFGSKAGKKQYPYFKTKKDIESFIVSFNLSFN